MTKHTKKIIISSMFAALCCVATMIIKIPSPLKGYINLGDAIVLLCGWILSPTFGFYAAGIGSALADFFLGYAVYVPATFVIKGIMAIVAYYGFKIVNNKFGNTISRIISGIITEITMILGYYVFEGLLYGFAESLVNIPSGIVQGFAGIVIGILVFNVFDKTKLF